METTDTQTRDIILRLKRVKAARGLSCGRICAMVAEAGGSVLRRAYMGLMPHPAVALDKKPVCGYYSRKRVFL